MKRANEIYAELEAGVGDERRLRLLFELATELLNFDIGRSQEVSEQLGAFANEIDSNLGRSFYHSSKARLLYKQSRFKEAVKEFQLASDMAMLSSDVLQQAVSLDSLGIAFRFQKKFKESEEASLRAIEILEAVAPTHQYKCIFHNNLGSLYKDLEDWEKAEQQYQTGLGIATACGDERMASNLLNNLSAIGLLTHNYPDATKYAEQALAGFKKLNHKHGEVHALVFVGHGLFGQGNYGMAMEHYLSALKLLKNVDHKLIEAQAYKGLGNVYGKMLAFDDAIKYYQKASDICLSVEDHKEACEIYITAATMYHIAGQTNKAADYLRKAYRIAIDFKLGTIKEQIKTLGQNWGASV